MAQFYGSDGKRLKLHRDWEPMIAVLAKQGWRLENTKTHIKAFSPNGVDMVAFPKSPSDWRAIKNKKSELKRMGVQIP